MTFLEALYFLVQLVLTAFVLGAAYEIVSIEQDDDDDDRDGGILQPAYVTNR